MAKVVITSLEALAADKTAGSEKTKRRSQIGKRGTKMLINVEANSFGDDLTAVFTKNVEKARRENRRLVGAADRVPAKV